MFLGGDRLDVSLKVGDQASAQQVQGGGEQIA
jgi:hypothetical protein